MTESAVRQRLAAILAADAAGYSRLMQDDERATVATLDRYRIIFRDRIEAHQGRVVDTAGDSVLAVFETAIGAAEAAAEIQDDLTDRNASLSEDRRMPFRIGIHLGDVIEKPDGTIYGDGVNIASRLESLADAGGIAVSEDIHHQIRHKIDVAFEDIGEHEVKNIADPVRAYRFAAKADAAPALARKRKRVLIGSLVVAVLIAAAGVGIGAWQTGWIGGRQDSSIGEAAGLHPTLPGGPSIAVLPLENQSGDPDQAYLSDGLTEDIIAALGRFSNLTVLARNATVRFAGTTQPPAEIGRALGVAYLLVGSVRRAGKQIRVNAQLVDAATGQHLWSDRYDNQFEDLFSVQDDITRNVAGALAVELTRLESARAVTKPPENLEAYDFVLRGWNLLRQDERSANFQARDMFEQAIAIDPGYASAYASLGAAYLEGVVHGYTEFVARSIEKAETLARQALSLQADNVTALRVLGLVYLQKAEFELAAQQLRQALALNPSDVGSYVVFGDVLRYSGRSAQAIEWFEAALRLDPNLDADSLSSLGEVYYLSGRYEDAIATAHEALKRNPDFYSSYVVLAAASAQLGRTDAAMRAAQEVRRLRPFFTIEWYAAAHPDPADVAHLVDGLRKAGLDTPGTDGGSQ